MENYIGQGATEYLVLLAVVLIVALVSVALLGSFTGTVGDAQMSQSQIYWRTMQPIGVEDVIATNNEGTYSSWGSGYGTVIITLRNNGAYPVELLAVTGAQRSIIDIAAGLSEDNKGYQGLSGEYNTYVSSRGGYATRYDSIVLQPGDKVTIGFPPSFDNKMISNNMIYPKMVCGNSYPAWEIMSLIASPMGDYYVYDGFAHSLPDAGWRPEPCQARGRRKAPDCAVHGHAHSVLRVNA